MDELVECYQGDFVKDIVAYLHRIGVFYSDTHRLYLAVGPFVLVFAGHVRITYSRRSRVRERGYR